jgi:hypothetical protein
MPPASAWTKLLATLPVVCSLGCGPFGKVEQGRVIHYDRDKGVLTLILDSNYKQPGKPRYDVLPPVTVKIPVDPSAMGPAPQAGKLVDLDRPDRKLVVFDPATQSLKTVQYTLIEERVRVARNNPRVAGMRFPIVDPAKQTITIYLPEQQVLMTFSVPPEDFARPADTWVLGDEVRYYFKDPGQALRLMNVTKTEVT